MENLEALTIEDRKLVVKKFLSFTSVFDTLIQILLNFFDTFRYSDDDILQNMVIREHRLLTEAIFEEKTKLTELYSNYNFDLNNLPVDRLKVGLLLQLYDFNIKVNDVYSNSIKIAQMKLPNAENTKQKKFLISEIRSFLSANFKQFIQFTGKIAEQTSFKKRKSVHLPSNYSE